MVASVCQSWYLQRTMQLQQDSNLSTTLLFISVLTAFCLAYCNWDMAYGKKILNLNDKSYSDTIILNLRNNTFDIKLLLCSFRTACPQNIRTNAGLFWTYTSLWVMLSVLQCFLNYMISLARYIYVFKVWKDNGKIIFPLNLTAISTDVILQHLCSLHLFLFRRTAFLHDLWTRRTCAAAWR